jgi:hypothetical protein
LFLQQLETKMRPDLERLIKEHETLARLTDSLIESLSASPLDIPGIVHLRNELAVALHEHLAKEDAFLYQKSLRASETDFQEAICKFESDFAALSADWSAYLGEWPADVIAADFDTFSEITENLLIRLKARIAHENALLYPLALQQGRILLRAS